MRQDSGKTWDKDDNSELSINIFNQWGEMTGTRLEDDGNEDEQLSQMAYTSKQLFPELSTMA